MNWIFVQYLFGEESWQNKQIGKYKNGKNQIRITVEHGMLCHIPGRGSTKYNRVIQARVFEDEEALDKWMEKVAGELDCIPDNQLSIAATIQNFYRE